MVKPVLVVHATLSTGITIVTIALIMTFCEYEDRCDGRDTFHASIFGEVPSIGSTMNYLGDALNKGAKAGSLYVGTCVIASLCVS